MHNALPKTSYIIGFLLSLIFTLIPYYLVVYHLLEKDLLIATILGFALLQLLVQLIFFLHLGREKAPRWNLIMLTLTFGTILLVVVGSIWIMHHLNQNMMPHTMEKFLIEDEGIIK
jgi:cytochrome o ubiquinol oxidase subunit IV